MTLIQPAADTQTEVSLVKQAFPFFFMVDEELRITEFGPCLEKIAPHVTEGSLLADHFCIARPSLASIKLEEIIDKQGLTFLLDLLHLDMTLRGQFLRVHTGLIFVGSLWKGLDRAFDVCELSLDDFAAHDPTPENWFIAQTRNVQLKELTELVSELDEVAAERKRLAKAEKELARDLNAAADLHVRFTEEGKIVEAYSSNHAFIPGHGDELIGRNINDTFGLISEKIAAAVKVANESDETGSFEYEFRISENEYFFAARVARTRPDEYLLLSRDISSRRKMELELLHKTLHDSLTGLPNRRELEERMASAVADERQLALFMLDLNDFKLVNDSLGHHVGDSLLIEIGNRLRQSLSSNAHPVRIGGDEFAIVVEQYGSEADLVGLADQLAERLSEPFYYEGKRINPACSIGIAVRDQDTTSEILLRNADIAMYEAKASSKAEVAIFSNAMHESVVRTIEFQSELQLAIEEETLVNFYQPIVDLRTGEMVAVEALVRWPHPTRGLLTPYHFIEIAEKRGLIVGLGDLVLSTACADIARLNANNANPIRVHVNASPIQFEQTDMVEKTLAVLTANSLPNELLSLEITESLLINDFENAFAVVESLREAGVGVSLDDFGMGYSSLAYLERFPFDNLKIDRSFTKKLDSRDTRSVKLVNSIVNLAKSIDLSVIAEGVETREQHDSLVAFGCEYGQGYLYGKPMPFNELPGFLETWSLAKI